MKNPESESSVPGQANPNFGRINMYVEPWVKQYMIDASEKAGMTLGTYCSMIMLAGARDTLDIPQPPAAAAPVPTISDVLRCYVEGSSLIGPCGERWPCKYEQSDSNFLGDIEFCGSCNIRVH